MTPSEKTFSPQGDQKDQENCPGRYKEAIDHRRKAAQSLLEALQKKIVELQPETKTQDTPASTAEKK